MWNPIRTSKYKALLPLLQAQAKLETANFTSNAYKELNNLWGMGCSKVRPHSQWRCSLKTYDGGRHLAWYKTVRQSVEDIILSLDYYNAPTSFSSVRAYATWLKSIGYYGTSIDKYTTALQSWIKKS